MEPGDARAFAALTVEKIARNTQLEPDISLEKARDQVARRAWRGYLGFSLAIEYRRRMVGFIGAGGRPASVGYVLEPALWGQGLMSEALAAFCAGVFARFPIDRIVADHFEDNPASGVVLRRAGFETTGFDSGTSPARVEPAALITYALRRENMRLCHEIP
jgi:RimJ/RimL family protein N-acetyltransferase